MFVFVDFLEEVFWLFGYYIELVDDNFFLWYDGEISFGFKNSKGWDGKLCVIKIVIFVNFEVFLDFEYFDDDNVVIGEEVFVDEGKFFFLKLC